MNSMQNNMINKITCIENQIDSDQLRVEVCLIIDILIKALDIKNPNFELNIMRKIYKGIWKLKTDQIALKDIILHWLKKILLDFKKSGKVLVWVNITQLLQKTYSDYLSEKWEIIFVKDIINNRNGTSRWPSAIEIIQLSTTAKIWDSIKDEYVEANNMSGKYDNCLIELEQLKNSFEWYLSNWNNRVLWAIGVKIMTEYSTFESRYNKFVLTGLKAEINRLIEDKTNSELKTQLDNSIITTKNSLLGLLKWAYILALEWYRDLEPNWLSDQAFDNLISRIQGIEIIWAFKSQHDKTERLITLYIKRKEEREKFLQNKNR